MKTVLSSQNVFMCFVQYPQQALNIPLHILTDWFHIQDRACHNAVRTLRLYIVNAILHLERC